MFSLHTALRILYRSNCISNHPSYELKDFVGVEFYCPHALADGNLHIQIMKKMLEFEAV